MKEGLYIVVLYLLPLIPVIYYSLNLDKDSDSYKYRMSPSDTVSSISNPLLKGTTTFFYPQSSRNPFLSPMDYDNIKKIEMEKKKKEELLKQLAEQQKKGEKKAGFADDFIKGVKLQGIIGKYAIINGDMVEEGNYYKKKFIVEKVGSNYVIINYKGKKYRLVIR
ncbi:MAG: hypothetical protein QXO21_04340 [Candidatus Anstonellales archaeon]